MNSRSLRKSRKKIVEILWINRNYNTTHQSYGIQKKSFIRRIIVISAIYILKINNEEYRMAEKHLRKCSKSLAIREMQINTTLRFHLTPTRMANIKDSDDSRCWWGRGERGTLLHCWWGCKLVQPLWKSVWRFFRKLDIVLITWGPSYTTPGHIPKSSSNI